VSTPDARVEEGIAALAVPAAFLHIRSGGRARFNTPRSGGPALGTLMVRAMLEDNDAQIWGDGSTFTGKRHRAVSGTD